MGLHVKCAVFSSFTDVISYQWRQREFKVGGRTTEWGGCGEGNTPPHTGLRLSERRATNIGLLYPKVRDNIGGIFPLTSPQPNYWGDVSPASPAGLTPVSATRTTLNVLVNTTFVPTNCGAGDYWS